MTALMATLMANSGISRDSTTVRTGIGIDMI